MKYLLLILLLGSTSIAAQKVDPEPELQNTFMMGTPAKARLQLTTSIVRERSCFEGHLALKLKFTFRNVGGQSVILDSRSVIARALVSRTLSAAASKKYIQTIRSDQWGFYFAVDPSDMSNFVIIPPGEAHDLETEQTRVSLSVTGGRQESKDDLFPGSYFLQVEVMTWTYFDDARKFKKAWSAKGYLWSEGLTSQPMPFVIEQNRPISKCS